MNRKTISDYIFIVKVLSNKAIFLAKYISSGIFNRHSLPPAFSKSLTYRNTQLISIHTLNNRLKYKHCKRGLSIARILQNATFHNCTISQLRKVDFCLLRCALTMVDFGLRRRVIVSDSCRLHSATSLVHGRS